ncbi:MAG: hypothetical protein FWH40_05855 [Coriobacteriia bacterium]|nr:hypothetical protein [Coriobacteriia bacterium]
MADAPKLRKILGSPDAPYLDSLKELISSQSRETILKWCINYVENNMLPIFEAAYPDDSRPREALSNARLYISDEFGARQIRPLVFACHAAARDANDNPAAQAAARACAQASSSVYELGHTLGIAYYGAAAAAYAKVGYEADAQTYEDLAAEECARLQAALADIAVEDEPDPCLIEWHM